MRVQERQGWEGAVGVPFSVCPRTVLFGGVFVGAHKSSELWGNSQENYSSKLLFKKRMFRETDETITEPQFVNLSYVQVRAPPR